MGASIRKAAGLVAKAGVAFVAFGAAVTVAFHRITKAGEQFNQKMNRSLAIMAGVSESVRKTMKRTALEVARTTTHSAEQAAESYFFLASAGLNVKQSIAALPTVAKFAQAGMFDMARATDLLTDAQSALGLTVEDTQQNMRNMRHVGDVLVKANTLANASVEQFSESLTQKAGAALKVLNKDIKEGVAVLAAFADQGVKGSDAGTALNIILRDLSTKAIKNAKAFAAYNIEVFDSSGKMRNLALVISDVEQALKGMSDKAKKATLLQLGFSDKSVIFLQTLLGLSSRINEYESALSLAGGTMKRVADKQLTPMEKALAKLKASWVALSDALKPAVDAVALLMETVADKLGSFTKALEPNAIVEWVEDSLNALERLGKTMDRVIKTWQFYAQLIRYQVRLASTLVTPALALTGRPGSPGMTDEAHTEAPGLGTRVRARIDKAARKREWELAKGS
jgi:TP901 family phage tail tape measure protein